MRRCAVGFWSTLDDGLLKLWDVCKCSIYLPIRQMVDFFMVNYTVVKVDGATPLPKGSDL